MIILIFRGTILCIFFVQQKNDPSILGLPTQFEIEEVLENYLG